MVAIRADNVVARRRGFTLIELLLVIVIIGVLLATALPKVGRSISRDRVNRAAFIVQGMLDEAGQISRRQGVPVTVTFASSAFRINLRSSGVAVKSRLFDAASDVGATLSLNPSAGITIFPTGRANAALTVTVTGGGVTKTVTRSTAGIIRRQ